jgi:CBS domain-containing protein
MVATGKPLTDLTAEDVMSRDVLVLPQHMPLRTAAQFLSEAHVSGAPVVDGYGRCVGVISSTDFVHWARDGGRAHRRCLAADCVCADWQVVEVDILPAEAVAAYMTPDPITALTTATVRELARRMLDAHIHRVIIVDPGHRPVGVVSSTDILAAVACAGKESGEGAGQ